jgi:hypothetical protein
MRLFGICKADDRRFWCDVALMYVLTRHVSYAFEHSNPWFTFLVYAYTMPLEPVQEVGFLCLTWVQSII